jgi:hypothetical protein
MSDRYTATGYIGGHFSKEDFEKITDALKEYGGFDELDVDNDGEVRFITYEARGGQFGDLEDQLTDIPGMHFLRRSDSYFEYMPEWFVCRPDDEKGRIIEVDNNDNPVIETTGLISGLDEVAKGLEEEDLPRIAAQAHEYRPTITQEWAKLVLSGGATDCVKDFAKFLYNKYKPLELDTTMPPLTVEGMSQEEITSALDEAN